jgi:mono/diheme cytochrome c family protein
MRALGLFLSAAGLLALGVVVGLASCGQSLDETKTPAERGEIVYRNVCTGCHNVDPRLPGALGGTPGPEIAGASRELIEAKVLRGEYPPGYQPKRTTSQMLRLPGLDPYIDDLAAYLAAAASPPSGK